MDSSSTGKAVITAPPSDLYLAYSPISSIKCASKELFFDKLGFKRGRTSMQMRTDLNVDMQNHVKSSSYSFLNRAVNPEAFRTLVGEFLDEHGSKYWGKSNRRHLQEPDVFKGFLCPRDTRRADSRLVEVVEQYFNWKATNTRKNDMSGRKLCKDIDFSTLTGCKADLIQPSEGVEPTIRRRRLIRRRVLSDDEETLKPTQALSRRKKNLRRARSSHSTPRREASQAHPGRIPSPLISSSEQTSSSAVTHVSVADEEQPTEEPIATSSRKPMEKGQGFLGEKVRGFEHIKTEPLTDDMMKRTMFLVTVHGSPSGPVVVPFTECGNFHVLFHTLIKEREVADDDAEKIDHLTTVFDWSQGEYGGRELGIRKHKAQDWLYFCDSLRRAHEMDADRFKGKPCEVVIKLHINHKRRDTW